MTGRDDFSGGRAGISARTFAVPLIFMLVHHLVLNAFAILWLFIYLGRNPEAAILLTPLELMAEANVMTYASLLSMLVLIPAYLLYLQTRKKKGHPLLEQEHLSGGQVFHSVVMILGAMGLTQLLMVLLSSLDNSSFLGRLFQDYLDKMALFDGRTEGFWMDFAATVILVPVAEELLMRGIIQGELARSFSPRVTVALTTFLFALFHLDLVQGLYVLIAGFVLSVTYHLTRNILIPIGLHILFNLIGSGWLSRLIGAGEYGEGILVLLLYACIIGGAGSFLVLRRTARRKKPAEA